MLAVQMKLEVEEAKQMLLLMLELIIKLHQSAVAVTKLPVTRGARVELHLTKRIARCVMVEVIAPILATKSLMMD